MGVNRETYQSLSTELKGRGVQLVAVSKTKPVEDIMELYELGHRHFGENYVQELVDKYEALPKDINWHFIGHLQTNKVKYIAPFVHLIHGVDSFRLLKEIDKQSSKNNRITGVLLQMHIAQEENKFGLDEAELRELVAALADDPLSHVSVRGMMGMASFTDDKDKVRNEFRHLKQLFDRFQPLRTSSISFETLSMGMSGDYSIAIEERSNLVRIGSLLFGERASKK
jgi:pyridoxal phosphate enzyme (YggS family)